jgi:hypothetical protein
MTLSPIVIGSPEPPEVARWNKPTYEELPTYVFDRIARHRMNIVPVPKNNNPAPPTFESMTQNWKFREGK